MKVRYSLFSIISMNESSRNVAIQGKMNWEYKNKRRLESGINV